MPNLHRANKLNIENYLLLEQIGEGGNGLVYKAEQISTGQHVAIKTLKLQGILDPQKRKHQVARFEREANLCARINHHNIVRLIDKGLTDQQDPYAVFEFVSGITLKQLVTQKQGLSALETKQLMVQVLDALICAHENGVIHRDLKPQNIMVTNTGARAHVKILDFGIGTFTQDFKNAEYQTLTLTQEFLGTPNYSAPEQLRGEPPTQKTDLYAWGLILLECLTGKPVIKGKSIAEVFQQQLMPSHVSMPPAIIGHPLGDLMRRVLEKNPQRRITSAQLILDEIEVINFNTLTGTIRSNISAPSTSDDDWDDEDDDPTVVNTLLSRSSSALRKQITVVGIKLNLILSRRSSLDLETLDAIEKDQLNLCKDIAIKYGGYIAGSISNHILVYFGYPEVHDTDARRAGRTALELIAEARKRSILLQEAHGISIELRASAHTGTVLVLPNQIPEGNVPNTAFELLYQTEANNVLVSNNTKRLLDPYLDFEFAKELNLPNDPIPFSSYFLLGERQTEALSAARSWGKQQKLIGRDEELNQLLEIWKKSSKTLQAVILKGEAGIGKSRLTFEVKQHIEEQGHLYRECRCFPEHQNNALYPFLSMLKKHWGLNHHEKSESDTNRLRSIVNQLAPDLNDAFQILCSWLSIPLPKDEQASQKQPNEQKRILFTLLERAILQIDSAKTLLLMLEDFHWADPTTKEFIDFLLSEANKSPLMLLITSRPTQEQNQWTFPVIELSPLGDSAVSALIQATLGKSQIDSNLIKYIIKRTDGIPLFVEELTTMLLEQKHLVLHHDKYSLVANIEDQSIPITLQDLLNAKLDRLGFAKETAQLAAAIGREFGYELLAKASFKDEAMIQSDLDQLIEADLIYKQHRVNEENFLFRHALISDAAYSGMTNSRQKEVHQRLAESLENYFPSEITNRPFVVARHWAGATAFDQASHYGIQTIKKLVSSSSNKEALSVNDQVTKWIRQIKDKATRLQSELILTENMLPVFTLTSGWGAKQYNSLVKRNHELLDQFKTIQGQSRFEISNSIAKSEWMLFSHYSSLKQYDKAFDIGDQILKRLKSQENHRLKMAVYAFMGQTHRNYSGNFDLAREMLETVIKECNEKQDLEIYTVYGFDPCVHAYGALGLLELIQGFPDKGIAYVEKGIQYAHKINAITPIASAYVVASLTHAILNNKAKTEELLKTVFDLYYDDLENTMMGKFLFMIEDWTISQTERTIQILEAFFKMNMTNVSYWFESLFIETLIENKTYLKALDWLPSAIERSDEYARPMLHRLYGNALSAFHGELTQDATYYFEQAIEIAKRYDTKWLELQTLVDFITKTSDHSLQQQLINDLHQLLEKLKEGKQTVLYQSALNIINQQS